MDISILIVDDDRLLADKLKETMNWKQLHISAVFTAYNIRQAMCIIEEYPIHILLCDIDMPQGNGLELLEWVRSQNREIECVFLSSYAYFSYVQMAMRLGSRDYLLKPISNAELEHVLEHVTQAIEKRQKELGLSVKNRREDFWEDFLLCRVPEAIYRKTLSEKWTNPPAGKYRLLMVRVLESADQNTGNRDYALLDFAIRNISYEFFQKNGKIDLLEAIIHVSNLEWMYVLKEEDGEELSGLVCSLVEELKRGNNRQVAVYLGQAAELQEIGKSRDRLEDMAQNAVLNEKGILYEQDWCGADREYIAPA